jgi:hypothetical protein
MATQCKARQGRVGTQRVRQGKAAIDSLTNIRRDRAGQGRAGWDRVSQRRECQKAQR